MGLHNYTFKNSKRESMTLKYLHLEFEDKIYIHCEGGRGREHFKVESTFSYF